jgi:hypothetical protein
MYTLHKIPEGFLVTSNEGLKIGDTCTSDKNIIDAGYIHSEWTIFKISTQKHLDILKSCLKVIAEQDQIDFSSLSGEEQKEIGYFDVEKLAEEEVENHNNIFFDSKYNMENYGIDKFTTGFQKAVELLSDKRFTLGDMYDLLDYIVRNPETKGKFKGDIINDFILSQPKSWSVELEMEPVKMICEEVNCVIPCACYHQGKPTLCLGGSTQWEPKLINDKIKITKIAQKKNSLKT